MTDALVVQTSFLGDMVLTTPLIAYLAARGAVDVLCTPASRDLLRNNPHVRDAIVYDKRGADRGVASFFRLAARLRAREYGAAYHAQASPRSGALTMVARIPERIGFASAAGRRFYTRRIAPIDNVHHAARLLSLGTGNPLREYARAELQPHLYPGNTEVAAVDELLASGDAQIRGEPLIALAPGSIWGTKRWPHYAALASMLGDTARVVVVGADADRSLALEIVAATNGRAVDATGTLSLLASAELVRRCALIVTNDSLPLHLASAMDTPTIAIFGPTVPDFGFGPLAQRASVAGNTALACRPCDRHGPRACPLGHWRCMREITADTIAQMAADFLSTRPS